MANKFSEELFLTNATGRRLYHTYAEKMPIIDYHCHLQPQEIAENKEFEDLGEMWLSGDHYKWRAMRTFGVDERLITGAADYHEKFLAFAGILPKLIGNPIYIWCALELKRYFDIDEPVSAKNAEEIYQKTKALIRERHMTRRWCMEHSNVKLVSTTEDPIDDLRWHKQIQQESFFTRVITAFRPDKAMFLELPTFDEYLGKLADAADMQIGSFHDLLAALEKRLQYFKEVTGTTVSDDGVPHFTWADYTDAEIEAIFQKARKNEALTAHEVDQYQSAFLFEMARIYKRNGYVMQMHIGTYLDANTKGVKLVGQSTGFDCTDDQCAVTSVGELLNRLTLAGELPKLILYPLDGTKIETWAVLAAGFAADGEGRGVKAKVQLGAPWWFNDQQFGIARQFAACANLYPVSLSVGMLTDSRSFISYPRHELYRRVLCNYFGELVERGEYFSDEEELGAIIEDICFNNVNEFFGFGVKN
ncbi:MAG: glucuronate isomerase [Oscillospiraceae bacterium]|nr:glucuronate isomerase [Oscillospiraceae bacterium]MBQ9721487.1 glucuronate isomerase [Oscillospiraceae bacterium]